MGFFSGSTTEVVSSVIYNLAGDGPQVSYVNSLIVGKVLMHSNEDMSSIIRSGLLNGPGLRLKNFTRWAVNTDYASIVGAMDSTVNGDNLIDMDALRDSIPHGITESVVITHASVGMADFTYWADRWVLENRPSDINDNYVVDLVSTNQLRVTFANGDEETFPLVGYVGNALYLYVSYQIKPLIGPAGPIEIIIYRQNTGNSLYDSFFSDGTSVGGFLPHIPVRINNQMVGPDTYPQLYPWVKRAMKKALPAGNFDKLVKDLEDNNPSIGDIDHATIIFGVQLTTSVPSAQNYIFEFFESMFSQGNTGITRFAVSTSSSGLPFQFAITWESLSRSVEIGLIHPDAKVGDVSVTLIGGSMARICKQITSTSFVELIPYALSFSNHVYNGKYIFVQLDAAGYTYEDYEQIVIPISTNILQNMSVIEANQLANYAGLMVFNCYEKVKTKWYESGILSLALMIVTVAVAIVTSGAGAAGAGAMSTAASIGSALGFSGLVAILVGTLVNAIASMLIMRILQEGATAIFGDQIGMLIGTIAAMIAVTYGNSYMSDQPVSASFTELASPSNLLKLTSNVTDGYASYLNSETNAILSEISALQQESENIYAQINDLTANLYGNSLNIIDPLDFTGIIGQAGENHDSFLARTLLTGTDIAIMGIAMLEDFPNISLTTPTTM